MLDFVYVALIVLEVLFVFVLIVFLISGLDDFFIDIVFLVRSAYRKFVVMRRHRPLTVQDLTAAPEQPVALMFPAWHEAPIIRRALTNTLQSLTYSNYHVFVGVYVNDPDTQRELAEVMRRFGNVHQIIVPHPGPTCKADCLNWIIKGIHEFQRERHIEFRGVVLHDAEDVVHPLSLNLFNYLLPRFDLIQIPVISLERPWWSMTGGHYMDEFAEAHCKELHVREWFAGVVPGAGVGTAYSMRALKLAAASTGETFSTDTLTEDYEFSFRCRDLGLKQIFVRFPVERSVVRHAAFGRRERMVTVRDYICTREFFPDDFRAAVRQKARWVIGIALQGWRKFGWRADWRTLYLFGRDRKWLIVAHAIVLGYVVAIAFMLLEAVAMLRPGGYTFAPPFASNSVIWYLVYANLFLMINRLVHRHVWTIHLYGWHQLPLVLPRYFWGNVVNYCAVTRALIRFGAHLRSGEPIGWDKTAHAFPDEHQLSLFRRRVGDLLMERRFLRPDELERALRIQSDTGRPLGRILMDTGAVKEDDLIQVLCTQLRLEQQAVDPSKVSLSALRRLPAQLAKEFSVFPVGETPDGRLVLACNTLPERQALSQLESVVGSAIELRLATRGDIAFALRYGYERLANDETRGDEKVQLGQKLLAKGLLSEQELESALQHQRQNYRALGEILLDMGAIGFKPLSEAITAAARLRQRLGDYLVEHQLIRPEQLRDALAHQAESALKLGDILAKHGVVSRVDIDAALRDG